MRIIAGTLRGRSLAAPSGPTRPTADRVRQALFDMLRHAGWAGDALDGMVLDGFAGSGALGLEALSRGAARAAFLERDRDALASIAANLAACRVESRALVVPADALRPPPAPAGWREAGLVLLDPPYGQGLVAPALDALRSAGWVAATALVVAEVAAVEPPPVAVPLLADRRHGAARLCAWRG